MWLVLLLVFIQTTVEQAVPQWDRAKIVIPNNAGPPSSYQMPRFDAGPSNGNMLYNHFFPGIDHYNAGRYLYAEKEFAYIIPRPYYLEGNPRRNEYMSTSHYLTGMIYLYHAEGLGRRNMAKENFEKAIQWNPNNYLAYIELARVFAELRFTKQASAVIQRLLEMRPPESVAEQARDELSKFALSEK
jgi:tetratricopeptide (TPR) repeat protein